jgi:hypothetical protein
MDFFLNLVCKCGNWGIRRRQADHRIINGIDAAPHAYPHQVGLVAKSGTKAPFCGGSIISPSKIYFFGKLSIQKVS